MGLGIIRRPGFAGGGLTNEEREKMEAHSALWDQRAIRTEPANPALIEEAVKGIYRAAKLREPRVIVVPSPFVMAMAGGIAGVYLARLGKKPENADAIKAATTRAIRAATNCYTKRATQRATQRAIQRATNDATDRSTHAAACVATQRATVDIYAATIDATYAATRDATRVAIDGANYLACKPDYSQTQDDFPGFRVVDANATWVSYELDYDAFYDATGDAICDATRHAVKAVTHRAPGDATTKDWLALAASIVGDEWTQGALMAAREWIRCYQEGNRNIGGADDCYLTAARDVLGLKLPQHAAYAYWEQAAINGGFRWMHRRFCLVSDFPEVLRVNADNALHAEFGPSLRWRDGFSIWRLNGISVDQWMAESHLDEMDARSVLQVENVDQRRECIRRMGMERIVRQLDPVVLDTERREVGGEYRLLAVDMNHDEPWRFLQMINQSIGTTHIEAVPRECQTVRHAINWRASQSINKDWFPVSLT
jgi:hypothetical protein